MMETPLKTACGIDADLGPAGKARIYSLPALERQSGCRISRLPISIRIVLESLLGNGDGRSVLEDPVLDLARWQPYAPRTTAPGSLQLISRESVTGT